MRGELKKYGIRATKKPMRHQLLSSLVLVRNEKGEVGYCYIGFEESLVEKVGRVLPMGLSKDAPGFISVRYYPRTEEWLVIASYVNGGNECLLWKTKLRPSWLNFYIAR